jgi:DNA polymerase-3 subunit alpha
MDFVQRIDPKKVNRKVWESLAKSGGFEQLGETRANILFNLDGLLALASKLHKEKATNQADLFGGIDSAAPSILPQFEFATAPEQMKDHDTLLYERELLGLYLSSHPLDGYGGFLEEKAVSIDTIDSTMDGKSVTIGGVVSSIRSITTKNGARMAFVKIEDKTSECELIVFPSVYEKLNSVWVQDQVVLAKGKINYKDRDGNLGQELKILVDQANVVSEDDAKAYQATGKKPKAPKSTAPKKKKQSKLPPLAISSRGDKQAEKVYVQVKDSGDSDKLLALKTIAKEFPGESSLILVLGENETKTALQLPFKILINTESLAELRTTFGEDCVVIRS